MSRRWLSFAKYFYDEQQADYGHVEGGEGVTCYADDSPFKPAELIKHGPFSCLKPEEVTKGVQSPYLYIGRSHTHFAWHYGTYACF